MEDIKKTGTSPVGASASAAAAGTETEAGEKRKQRSASTAGKRGKGGAKKDAGELRFEAIRALSNLPEGGKFFLVWEAQDGRKDTINAWS